MAKNAETRDRTGDLQIFGLTLSQLSYRGCVLVSHLYKCTKVSPRTVDEYSFEQQSSLPDSLHAHLNTHKASAYGARDCRFKSCRGHFPSVFLISRLHGRSFRKSARELFTPRNFFDIDFISLKDYKNNCNPFHICSGQCAPLKCKLARGELIILLAQPIFLFQLRLCLSVEYCLTRLLSKGTWCSGITSASHPEGPGFKSQCVHFRSGRQEGSMRDA